MKAIGIKLLFLFFIVSFHSTFGQIDSSKTINKSRLNTSIIATASAYSVTTAGLYTLWYKDIPSSSFHLFNDLNEWNQGDKCGHMYSAYLQSKVLTDVFRWTGMKSNNSAILGSSIAFTASSSVEFFDGISQKWGASLTDIGANFIGSATFLSQELIFKRQIVHLKYSFTFNSYQDPILKARSEQLYGSNIIQRFVKDYNGTTLWLCTSSREIFPKSKIPKWMGIAVGFGNSGMFGGVSNQWTDIQGTYYDRTEIVRYRKFLLSPDIDFSQITTKNKPLNTLIYLANFIKMPLPTLEYNTKGELILHPFYAINFRKEF